MSNLDKKERVSDPDALSRDPEAKSDEVIIERSKNSPKATRRGLSDSDKEHSPPQKDSNSDEEDKNGSDSKQKKDQSNSAKSIKTMIQEKIKGKDKKAADKKLEGEAKKKEDDEESLVDAEKGKKAETGAEKKTEQPKQAASSGPTIMAAMKARFAAVGEGVKSRIPSLPTRQQVTSSLTSRLPSLPQISRPNISLPPLPQIQVSQYLPEMPSCPKIPLPDQVQVIVDRFDEVNDSSISPLIQRLNVLVLCLSLLCILIGNSVSDYLVYMPDRVISFRPQGTEESNPKTVSFPYFWTFFTTIFIEESFLYMIGQLLIINYIVYKNRAAFENAWCTKDFYVLLAVSSTLSLMTQTLIRLSILGIFKNVEAYKSCRYSGLNFVVMALLLGLRQQAFKKPPAKFQAVISETESKSGVKQITFAQDPFSTQAPSVQANGQTQGALSSGQSQPVKASPKEFDTGIPFILGTIKIPYGILPQLYILFTLSIEFLFELPFNLKIIYDFFWIWFYIRFFMKTKMMDGSNSFEVGDLSTEFGIHSFFPQRLQPPVLALSDFCYALLNMCGLVNCTRRWLKGEAAAPQEKAESASQQTSSKSSFFSWLPSFTRSAKSGEDTSANTQSQEGSPDSAEQKKAALDFLDEEIKSLNKASGSSAQKKKPSKLDSMAAKQMAALGNLGKGASQEKGKDSKKKSAGWEEMDSSSSGAGLSGDLDFNDLEIQFDDHK